MDLGIGGLGIGGGGDGGVPAFLRGGGGALSYAEEVLADGPLGYWRLEETSGTDIADSSGNGNDGVITLGDSGSPDLTQPGIPGSDEGDTGAEFLTVTDAGHISFGSTPWSDIVDGLTLEAWIIPSPDGSSQKRVISRNKSGYRLTYKANTDEIFFVVGSTEISASALGIGDGEWHHVVGTFDTITARIFVDGVEVVNSGEVNHAVPNNSENLYIGWEDSGIVTSDKYKGSIDEPAIYDYRLPDNRILAHYNAGIGA